MRNVPNEDLKVLAAKEEPRFLSILLKSKESLMNAASYGISPDHFREEENQFLAKVIFSYFKEYSALLTRSAMDSVIEKQSNYTDAQKSARKSYWDKISQYPGVNVEDFEMLKKSLNDRFIQRQAFNIVDRFVPDIINSTKDQEEVVKQLQDEIGAIGGLESDTYSMTVSADVGWEEAMKHVVERRNNPGQNAGILSGIKAIDDVYYGFTPGSYTVISGMTNGGKTTLMFNLAFNMARSGKGVVYVSLEKEAVPLFVRLLALHAEIDYNRIKRGGKGDWGLPDHIFRMVQVAHDDLTQSIKPNLDIIQLPQNVKLTRILAEIDKIKAKKKVDVIVVDYLGVIGFETKTQGRPDLDQAMVSKRLQAYGRINKFATITAVQIKASSSKNIRDKAKKAGDNDDLSEINVHHDDLAGSQEVIRDADNSMGVVLNADKPPTKMFVSITKARDNEAFSTLSLHFDGRIGKVCDHNMSSGYIKAVDDLIYDENVTEEKLKSEDNLYDAFSDPDAEDGSEDLDTIIDESVDVEEPTPEPEITETTTTLEDAIKENKSSDALSDEEFESLFDI